MDRDELLRLLRDDPEVQGAVLALLARALDGSPGRAQPSAERPKPDWVRRALDEQGKS